MKQLSFNQLLSKMFQFWVPPPISTPPLKSCPLLFSCCHPNPVCYTHYSPHLQPMLSNSDLNKLKAYFNHKSMLRQKKLCLNIINSGEL